jgi:Tfp pilus assembly protein PilO
VSAGRIPLKITGRSVLVALGVVVVVVAWALAVYLPQSHKLTALQAQKATLQSTVAADEAHLQQVMKEDQHLAQIKGMYNQLEGFVPSTADVYTYIRTISGAAKLAHVSITSLAPSTLAAVSGTGYSAIPITASVKGSYDHLLEFLKRLYDLPRLTDVNGLSITGGGPGTNRGTLLTATFQLAIFTSQQPGSGAS